MKMPITLWTRWRTTVTLCAILTVLKPTATVWPPKHGPSMSNIRPPPRQPAGCPTHCRCRGINAICKGEAITEVPTDLPSNITKLFLTETRITAIRVNTFTNLTQLRELRLRDSGRLEQIHPGAFNPLKHLTVLEIYDCSRLQRIPAGVLADFKSLKTLTIWRSLKYLPDFSQFNTYERHLDVLDLSNNLFEEVGNYAFGKIRAYYLKMESTRIRRLHDHAFDGAYIGKLFLGNNGLLTQIDDDAFTNIHTLQSLDLSGTAISRLPINGLTDIEELSVTKTETLRVFPSVYSFKKIRIAALTYPHHCCAFQNPHKQDPSKFAEFQRMAQCPATTASSNDDVTQDGFGEFRAPSATYDTNGGEIRFKRQSDPENEQFDRFLQDKHMDNDSNEYMPYREIVEDPEYRVPSVIGFGKIRSHGHTVSPREDNPSFFHGMGMHAGNVPLSPNDTQHQFALCGEVTMDYRHVVCTPVPDALNPCEDVMGYQWLRVIVWFVLLAAIFGNIVVIIVLLTTKVKMSVTKFLMCNLAFGDFLMGVYLLLLASIDARTLGEYFNFAISWQTEGGCQAAGFLTVLSSELSIYTLTVITLERWYAISHAIHLTKRLKLRQAAVIMIIGWVYSCVMAILPFLGVSSYGTVSICLPMKVTNTVDLAYVLSLLIVNGLAFFAICMCYISMYWHVKGNDNRIRNGDATIAKRMALLVFTNFACWAPIAFFGLTASAGWPLIDITKSKILLVFFYPLNSCANPFLYAIFTKHFRRDLFILLSKYDICTNRANMYKGNFSKSITQTHTRNTVHMQNAMGWVTHDDNTHPSQINETTYTRASPAGSMSAKSITPLPSPIILKHENGKLSLAQEVITAQAKKTLTADDVLSAEITENWESEVFIKIDLCRNNSNSTHSNCDEDLYDDNDNENDVSEATKMMDDHSY